MDANDEDDDEMYRYWGPGWGDDDDDPDGMNEMERASDSEDEVIYSSIYYDMHNWYPEGDLEVSSTFNPENQDSTPETRSNNEEPPLDIHLGTRSNNEEPPLDIRPEEVSDKSDTPPPQVTKVFTVHHKRNHHSYIPGYAITLFFIITSLLVFGGSTQAIAQENVIFESIGEMAGATSYLHVQATISLSSITKQFEMYKEKLKARFTDPHKVANVMNHQFARNLNTTVDTYLDEKKQAMDSSKKMFQPVPAPHMNTAVIWTRIAQLHYEDLYEIGLSLASLKSLLPKLAFDSRDRIIATSNFFKNIQPNMRKDNLISDDHEVENEFLEQYPDLQLPDHLSQRLRRSPKHKESRFRFDQGMPLFQPPGDTRLEDWFLMKVQDNVYQDSYWFHVCPPNSSPACKSHAPVPQTILPPTDRLGELVPEEDSIRIPYISSKLYPDLKEPISNIDVPGDLTLEAYTDD